MSILIDDCSAMRDALPRFLSRSTMPTAAGGWRRPTGSTMRGFEAVVGQQAQHPTQDGRTGTAGAYVAANKHFSIRSGPPTSRP